jgi:hypothetical protein
MLIRTAPLWILLFGLLVSAASLKLGVRMAGASASWGRAFLAVIILYPTGMFVTFVGSLLLTPPVGLILGLVAVLAVIKVLFGTTWPQTLIIWLVMTVFQILLFIAAAVLTGLGLHELIKQMNQFIPKGEVEVGLDRIFPGLGRLFPGPSRFFPELG